MSSPTRAEAVAGALEACLGLSVESVALTRGGDINDAFRVETSAGPVFVKTSADAQPGMFTDEAAGLEWLAEPGTVATPRVVGVHDPSEDDGRPRLLALEWIDEGPVDAEALGRGLAGMHRAGAPSFGFTPGPVGHSPMRFNALSLPNDPLPTFAEFYAQNRIVPLAEQSQMSAQNRALMLKLADRIADFAGPEEPPSRIHGDLWLGNVTADASGAPVLIDPVAHGGHREVDLANLRIFGSPGPKTFAAYNEAFPLAEGHEDRIPLWQLAMILLHVYLFGGSYEQQAVTIAHHYL